MSRENVEVIRRMIDAFNRRDLDALADIVAPDIVFETTVEAHRGHEGVVDFIRQADDTLEGFHATIEELIEVGDRVVAVVRERGRGKGSGVEVEHRFAHLWTVRDGRAVSFRAFTGRAAALEAADLPE